MIVVGKGLKLLQESTSKEPLKALECLSALLAEVKADLSACLRVKASTGLLKTSEDLLALQADPLVHLLLVAEVLSEDFMAVALAALMVAASHAAEDCRSHC
ncbi:MAG: hypothetical protein ABSB22_09440 [Thermodesulfobacteriota bacterium]